MKKVLLFIIVIVAVAAIFVGLFVAIGTSKYGIVKGKIADELSQDPVRGIKIVVNGRSTILYQTTDYQLTKIVPGEYTIETFPPLGWIKFTKTIKVKSGNNQVDISLKGDKIPDLTGIICFTESEEEGIIVEVRFVDSEGMGMTEFPQLPIKIDATLWEKIGEEDTWEKGKKLFEGTIEYYWDSQAYLAKNKGILTWDKLSIKFKDEKSGVMEIQVHLEQGNFKDTVDDVQLFPKKEET